MPKGRDELERLSEAAKKAITSNRRAQAEYAAVHDAYVIAAALEEAITRLVGSETRHAVEKFDEILSVTPWGQWEEVISGIRLPDYTWLAGACLMDPSRYRQQYGLLNRSPTRGLLERAIHLVEKPDGWPSGPLALVVVDGRFCGNPFREFCVHFEELPPTAP